MPIETVELTGSGATGIRTGEAHVRTFAAPLPTRVCLGRIKPKARPSCLKLSAYLGDLDASALPESTNWREKAGASIARTYLNDQYGCCVFSGKAHNLGVWSANDSDSGGIVLATDAEIKQQYFDYTGGRDGGASISEVLDIMRSKGFMAGGKFYKIDGYVEVDWTNQNAVKAAQVLFGASSIGFELPQGWLSNAVWDASTAGGRTVGGHDVSPIDYDDQGVYVSSWGRIYLMTWPTFMSRKWTSEYYAMLAPLWYGKDMVAPCKLKVDELRNDLTKIGGGEIPDIRPPIPDVPTAPDHIRLNAPLGAGIYEGGKIVLGSNMGPGEYAMILGGDGPPPVVPDP